MNGDRISAVATWKPVTIGRALSATAGRWVEREALVVDGRRITYGQLWKDTRRAAGALLAQGVRRGDHVAICLGNSAEWETMLHACATIGAVAVPVNTRFKADELRYCLGQAEISLLVTADKFLGKIDFIAMLREIEPAIDQALPGAALPRLRHVVVLGDDVPKGAKAYRDFLAGTSRLAPGALDAAAAQVTPEDVALIQYTSGTTSFPKGAMLTHHNMLRNAVAVAERIGIKADDRYFSVRPFFHVAGSTLAILVALIAGATLVTMTSFEAGAALEVMEQERCTLISGNDTIFLMLMNHPRFDRARLALRGGWAAAGPEVFKQAIERMGAAELCFAYGLSEASPNVVLSWFDEPAETRIAGLALPHDGVEVRIVKPGTSVELEPDQVGEIQVRGWNVMKGYFNKPEETAQTLTREGWLRTGDLGVVALAGRLRFVGRVKDVFRVGGENVAPAEVEEVLHAHPKVAMAQVVGVPDDRLGEVPAAYIRLRDGESAEPDEFAAWCRERCANFKVPRYVRIVDGFETLGMTGSSKVQKQKLRAQALIDFGLGPK